MRVKAGERDILLMPGFFVTLFIVTHFVSIKGPAGRTLNFTLISALLKQASETAAKGTLLQIIHLYNDNRRKSIMVGVRWRCLQLYQSKIQ
jgi:hypothetical protein